MYIIDGHNLIPKIPGLRLDIEDDEMQLIAMLQDFCAFKHTSLDVYFDRAAPGRSGKRKHGNVTAYFVHAMSTADNAIINRVRGMGKNAKNNTVVTSDHRIATEVRARGATVISSEQFARLLQEAYEAANKGAHGGEPRISEDEVNAWLDVFKKDKKSL